MKPIRESLLDSSRRIYFLGIGGVGMSGIAKVLHRRGFDVAGSDKVDSRAVRELRALGIPVQAGQEKIFLTERDLVVYSSAIRFNHPEMIWAREKNLPIIHRAQALASLFNQAETSIGITGTHGKTTTSGMISFVLSETRRHPTCLVGGDIVNLGSNAIYGGDEFFVAEVDESDGSQEYYAPHYVVLTNLEEDHMDHYKDIENLKKSMGRFLSNLKNPGLIVYSAEDPVLRQLVPVSGKPCISYGLKPGADVYADRIRLEGFHSEFEVYHYGFYTGKVVLSVPGIHNVQNALGAIAVLLEIGLDLDEITEALFRFRGARRRLEVKFDSERVVVIDDYAHHPAEVAASIRALTKLGKHLTVIFQPHRFSRTQYLGRQFGEAFREANELILTEIYGAGEENPDNITSELIYNSVREAKHPSVKMISKDAVIDYLLSRGSREGVIAFLGAGDIGEVADEFARRVKSTWSQDPASV
ncbi:MAG: UDP-N-acetylmuramate--L-alanine ligase [Candidatus Omnitrophica bacterium]|nr:UDP-N-acetylmuramate--L-alanine ligase [Candidatus Omnitrophota bacterium]